MRRFVRGHCVSPALVISIIALVVAAAGTSFAAAPIGFLAKTLGLSSTQKHQVTSIADKQISGKASKLSVLYARSSGSATTATNATNAANATHATDATNASNAETAASATNAADSTDLGGIAASAYQTYGATLPSGDTETGVWGGGFFAPAVGDSSVMTGSFPVPLAATLNASHVVFASSSAADCPGRGQADRGYLCVYLGQATNTETPASADIYNPEQAETLGAGANGFAITVSAGTGGEDSITGSFAVTAP